MAVARGLNGQGGGVAECGRGLWWAGTQDSVLWPHPYSLEVEGGVCHGVTWTGPERQRVPSL